MIQKICLECQKEFQAKTDNKKFCSLKCYHKSHFKKIINGTTICSRCKIYNPISEFRNSQIKKDGKIGIMSWCKECDAKRKKIIHKYICNDCSKIIHRCGNKINKNPEDIRCNKCSKDKIIRDNGGNTINYTGTLNFTGSSYRGWVHSAKRRGYEWNLTKEQIEQKLIEQNGFCALSGIKLLPRTKSPYCPSLDRIDSNKGYYYENIQIVCSMVNVMKNKFNEKEFIEVCRLISNKATKILENTASLLDGE